MANYGKSFVYNGKSSEDFDLTICGFSTVEYPLNLKRNTTISSINRYRKKVNMYGINYDSILSFTVQLMKDPCKYTNNDELKFSRQEVREIAAWLTSPLSPRLFHMTDYESDNPQEEYDYFGVFTNVEAADNNIFTLNCTFECNTPYALSAKQSVLIDSGEGTVENPSDDYEDYVYPQIIITPTAGVMEPYSITITNVTDSENSITLNNMKPEDIVTMDCQKLVIYNESGSLISFDDIDIDALDYIYWPRLLHGDNEITVDGDATVEFVYRYPVKVGAY